MIPSRFESPEFLDLYAAYTAAPESIAARFVRAAGRLDAGRPLIVATHGDIALYPGFGRAPSVEGFRHSARGFKEMAAVSHLGPAMATLARIKEHHPGADWRTGAEDLLSAVRGVRGANSAALWRDQIRAAALAGREAAVARMVDYSCRLTERVLERALADHDYLTSARLRQDYLHGPAEGLPVSIERVMVATFFLTGMDISYRLITWFDGLDLPWEDAMVVIAGQQGRPTAGVTRDSNSIAKIIQAVSRGRLPHRSLLIAPHAPVFPLYEGGSLDQVVALEGDYRRLWSATTATVELGEDMFAGSPRFEPDHTEPLSARGAQRLTEMPAVSGPDDWVSLVARLRLVLEDPRQLLSSAVTDYASQQLVNNDNDPTRVVVPGLDGEPYPELATPVPSSGTATSDPLSPTPHSPGTSAPRVEPQRSGDA